MHLKSKHLGFLLMWNCQIPWKSLMMFSRTVLDSSYPIRTTFCPSSTHTSFFFVSVLSIFSRHGHLPWHFMKSWKGISFHFVMQWGTFLTVWIIPLDFGICSLPNRHYHMFFHQNHTRSSFSYCTSWTLAQKLVTIGPTLGEAMLLW